MSVVALFYHAPHHAPGLVEALRRQKHPSFPDQEDWLSVILMDNGSTDRTGEILARQVALAGSPRHWQIVTNPENLGYARAMNKALGLVRTPYVLTCHSDCQFASDDYVATMADLLDRHPEAGAIAGQPAVPARESIPFAEKVNLVASLMDIFPSETSEELVPVGFAEGRCDAFRLSAVAAAGFYDESHHAAGEDQILSARMRRAGLRIYQAPRLRYFLSVSDEQDTVGKLLRHVTLFGEKHPFLVLRGRAGAGVVGEGAGANRRARFLLRLNQLASVLVYLGVIAAIAVGARPSLWGGALGALLLAKILLFSRHMRAVRLGLAEAAGFFLLQPALDVCYTGGFVRGLWLVIERSRGRAASLPPSGRPRGPGSTRDSPDPGP